VSRAVAAPRPHPLDRVPPATLVIAGATTVQVGAAFATTLFDELGPAGTVFLRLGFAALALLALWRPRLRGHTRRDLALAGAFGLSLAAMNFSFYEALDRIPLGVTVTIEMLGPLSVAVAGSRKLRDLAWIALAAIGVGLLSGGPRDLDPVGVVLALTAGTCWAGYILLSARVGRTFPGGGGLALAMAVGALLMAPVGVAVAGTHLLRPELLAGGALVALLSSMIPYSLELEALRRMSTRVFGVLMSLEPALAALAGLIVISQGLGALEVVAIAFVMAACVGVTLDSRGPPRLDA